MVEVETGVAKLTTVWEHAGGAISNGTLLGDGQTVSGMFDRVTPPTLGGMRRWIGIAAVFGGVAIIVVPYRHVVPFKVNGQLAVQATARCVPVRDAFKKVPDGGWFGYAPGTRMTTSLDPAFCSPTARQRFAFAMIPAVAGAAMLVWDRRRRAPRNAAA